MERWVNDSMWILIASLLLVSTLLNYTAKAFKIDRF